MKITALQVHPFRVPLRRAFASARTSLLHRDGLLVSLRDDRGHIGWGEAAPMPGLGRSWLGAAYTALVALQAGLELNGPADAAALAAGSLSSPLAGVALETACLDLEATVARVPLARVLGSIRRERIPVNATLDLAAAESVVAAQRLATQGFRCFKVKVGKDVDAEALRLGALRAALGGEIALRLDANGAWSVEQAIAALRHFAALDIEYIEQPVADIAGLAALRPAVGVCIAADECIADVEDVEQVAAARAADVVVIKPSWLGLRRAAAIARAAHQRGLAVVVTSVLDTSVGITAALHLAATLRDPLPPCGLATASLLAGDLVAKPMQANGGYLVLPSGPGLGVVPDAAALDRYRLIPEDL